MVDSNSPVIVTTSGTFRGRDGGQVAVFEGAQLGIARGICC